MDISRHISHLLFEHECVIIPGFGGFVSSYSPANIHPVQNMFHPPSKSLLFNPELKTNDGLLANQISVSRKITYSQALEIIHEFVNETLETINEEKQVTLENIGVIYADQEGNLQFNQDTKNNYLKDSYGLTSFVSPKINRNYRKTSSKPEPLFTDRKGKATHKKRNVVANMALIVIPVLLTFGYFYFNTNVFDSRHQNKTSFVPDLNIEIEPTVMPSQQISNADKLNDNVDIQDIQKTENVDLSISQSAPPLNIEPGTMSAENGIKKTDVITTPKIKDAVDVPSETKEKLKPPVVSTGKMFYLIGGSFARVENADKLIAIYSQKGFKPQIVGQASNGYYRVSIMAYLQKEEAMAELRKIRENEIPGAWVLRQ